MCISEYIAYHCGHRAPTVIRPCPLTTAAPAYPPCNNHPTRQHNASTMCPACERTLHFRWVLIREWEHRWLHERGVCTCDAIFPGLLYQPRVSAPPTAAAANHHPGDGGGLTPVFTVHNPREVSVRVPGLYAAEWVADHRAVHAAGGCQCPMDMRPVSGPAVEESELTPQEAGLLARYRAVEHPSAYDAPTTEDEDRARVDEIARLFGEFSVLPTPMTVEETFAPPAPQPTTTRRSNNNNNGGRGRTGRHRGRRSSFWLRYAQKSRTDHRIVCGSGPYWNTGFEYHDGAGQTGGKGKQIAYDNGGQQQPILCGLPMGAGPENIEGHHHVGDWERCVLFGSGTSIGRFAIDKSEGAPVIAVSPGPADEAG